MGFTDSVPFSSKRAQSDKPTWWHGGHDVDGDDNVVGDDNEEDEVDDDNDDNEVDDDNEDDEVDDDNGDEFWESLRTWRIFLLPFENLMATGRNAKPV